MHAHLTLCCLVQGTTESFHEQTLEDFTFEELHKLMHLIGLKRKPDEVLAQENAMVRSAFFFLIVIVILFD